MLLCLNDVSIIRGRVDDILLEYKVLLLADKMIGGWVSMLPYDSLDDVRIRLLHDNTRLEGYNALIRP